MQLSFTNKAEEGLRKMPDKAMSTTVIHINDYRSAAEAKGYFKFKTMTSTAGCAKSSMKGVMIDVHTAAFSS